MVNVSKIKQKLTFYINNYILIIFKHKRYAKVQDKNRCKFVCYNKQKIFSVLMSFVRQ